MFKKLLKRMHARCGAATLLRRVKNPIRLARKVMEATPHVLLSGMMRCVCVCVVVGGGEFVSRLLC